MMLTRRLFIATALGAAAFPALAGEPPIYSASGLALGGYDPVSYFSEGGPVRGKEAYQLMWMGTTWRFSTATNRERFERMPQKYAPAYGGYCAYAASEGYVAPTDPEAFTIHEGRLFLNASRAVRTIWTKSAAARIETADKAWPGLVK